jgi:glycosyltransferase involved in cell wall biosynthesis
MSRLKVFHVITKLEFGGAQQNTLYTVSHLDRGRFEPVLASGRGGMLDAKTADAPYRTVFVDPLVREVRPLSDLAALFELAKLMRAERPDIVHTHSSKAGILGRLAAFLARVPVVIHTFHGFGFNDRQAKPKRWAYVAAEWFCAKLSDALVFVSNANMDEGRRLGLGAPSKHRLIRSGVALADFPPSGVDRGRVKAAAGIGMHKPLILSIGNLKPQKNPEDFVRLAKRVLGSRPDARFLFVGDGELRTRCEALILKENIHGKVLFPGWRRDTAELLAAADVFVLTSLWEGLPRSLVEAMRTGLPAVCYDVDGVRDLLQEGVNGYLAVPGDVGALAARVDELLGDDALRRRMGEQAKASVGDEYDIDGMVRSQERLYEELSALKK